MKLFMKLSLVTVLAFVPQLHARVGAIGEPVEYVYSKMDGVALKAYVFSPNPTRTDGANSAIVIFHGGGWVEGEPSWAFGRAKHFAELGMIAVAAQYRLSDQKNVTPIEAMADAQEIIKWLRVKAASFHVDPNRIAAYGWSAGAHLAASAAMSHDSLAAPNVLILVSPAVALEKDRWFKKILLGRAEVASLSPDKNVRKGLPATIILQGRNDTVTPLDGVQAFAERMIASGNLCELIIFDGVGHLFTPASEPDDGFPNPDAKIQAEAYAKADEFLRKQGYIKKFP